ncbi:Choline kinase alpha [Seminavis robusta]|uniref:ethanolamine kinase n=1 Tax=Seminavis robusta TaxID=568900 RepID=A0A9N8HP38_9STRA|nr:Choline kinase alpha [Seminavis robusta]|eukprot:Sro1051_g235620.1 Choline kinase alpha (382) ;mRNA; f:557-1702
MSGPKAYIAARDDVKSTSGHVIVDGKPYFPLLKADGAYHASIREVVAQILSIPVRNDWPISVVSGGITNQLFRVTLTCNNGNKSVPSSILLRIFGAEGMIDRDVENSTFAALSTQCLAPPYFGRFQNGRLEGWLDGMACLTPRDMALPTISPKIAEQMALLHAKFEIPDELVDYHNPQQPSLWTQLQDWMEQAMRATDFGNDTERAQTMVSSLLQNLDTEFEWLRNTVVPSDLPVAFCHNDVLGANVLYNATTGVLRLVDFEYGGVNYKAFDIANHFNEFAGGSTENGVTNYDWFPNKEDQCAFLKVYLESSSQQQQPSDEEIQKWYDQVQAFILVNHLYWGTWAVNQAATEGCADFDYLLFGHNRLSRYFHCKAEAYPSS